MATSSLPVAPAVAAPENRVERAVRAYVETFISLNDRERGVLIDLVLDVTIKFLGSREGLVVLTEKARRYLANPDRGYADAGDDRADDYLEDDE